MQISEDIKNKIVAIAGPNIKFNNANTGSLIFSPEACANQLFIITEGTVRLIDSTRKFNSKTIMICNSFYLIGLSNLLGINLYEEVRANANCKFLIIDLLMISDKDKMYIYSLLKNIINPFELLYIVNLIERKSSTEISSKYTTISDFSEQCFLYSYQAQYDNYQQIIFLDKGFKGFSYGQFLTKKVCETFFDENNWPRMVIISNKINHQIDNNNRKLSEPSLDFNFSQTNSNSILISYEDEEVISEKEEVANVSSSNSIESNRNISNNNQDVFKYINANTREESYFSCVYMLIDYFDMPVRKDIIKRAAKFIENEEKSRINLTLNLLDKLGLSVRLINVNLNNPLLLPSPSLWIDGESNCNLIVRSDQKYLHLFDPINGLKLIDKKNARSLFSKSPKIITVEVGLNTPRNRFGLAWMLPYVQKFKNQLIEVFAASFLNQLFQLATPLLFQQIIDRVLNKGASEALTPLVVLMLVFSLLEIIFSSLRTFQFVEISNRIDIGIGSAILSRMLRLNARFFDSRPVGELSSRLNELENIRRFLTGTALTVVLDAIFSILYFSVMIFYSPLLTAVVFISVPLLFLVTVGVTPITQKLIRLRAEAQAATNALLVEILGGIHTIKLQNAEFNARRQWEDKHLNSINQGFKAILANTTSSNAGQLINKLSNIVVIGLGAWLVLKNELTLGQLIAFRIISGYVTQPMLRLSGSWQQFQEMSLSLQRVGDIVNQPLEILENEENNIEMPKIKGDIISENVSFSYSSSSPPVLNSVNLKISKGSFVGLVGQSGCGKSSFLKMIPRLYRPTSGRLLMDNFDITKVDLYSLRQQIGFVPQDCMLFEGTVFSNIALGDPESDSKDVVEAAKIACAHEFIMSLPYGYGTPVGEKGSGLSGGQRQRIALARMLLENPNLVVLDEATSALDVDTEKQVVSNLRDKFSGRTLLMITHRLSTIVEADQIICMHAGRVDSVGKHEELMNKKGRYYTLYNSQFGEANQ